MQVDKKSIRSLIEFMRKEGVDEIEITPDSLYISLNKPDAFPQSAVTVPSQQPVAPSEPVKNDPYVLKAIVACSVYLQASPGAEQFVKEGDTVVKGQSVLMMNVMKVFQHIKAHMSGRVDKVYVSNGQVVEYGTPLIRIVPLD